MANVKLLRPRSLDEALESLDRTAGDATIMAGGTIVMYAYHAQLLEPSLILFLGDAGLQGVRANGDTISVGATTTLLNAAQALAGTARGAALAGAIQQIGTRALQAQGTLGGNLFAPPPSGDLVPALIALDAQVHLRSTQGERTLAVEAFVQDLGTTVIRDNELLTEISLPAAGGALGYERFTYSRGLAPAIVTAAAWISVNENGECDAARIAVSGAGPHAFRADRAEQALVGRSLRNGALAEAGRLAAEQASPDDDGLASAWYRRRLTSVLVERAIRAATDGGEA